MPGALTRIRNNQVFNSDIDAATKLVAGSITGALWANPLIYTGNLSVGNLTVNGVTTTLDTTNIVAADPLIVLNRSFSGANTYDVGMVLGRGNQTNTAFIWNESNKEFAFLFTTESTIGATTGTINNSGYANLAAYGGRFNNITVTTSTLTNFSSGNVRITGGYIDGTGIGANTPNTGVFTTLTATSGYNGAVSGPMNGTIGASTPNTGAFTSITASTTATITGNASAGNITASGVGGQIIGYHTGAIGANVANTGVFTSVATVSGGQLTGYHTGPIGANVANTGVFTTLTATVDITAQ